MSHARVEELSDSDPEIDDPSSYLPDSDLSIIAPANLPPSTSTSRSPGLTFGHSNTQQYQPQPTPQSAFPSGQPTPQTILRPQAPSAQKQSRDAIKPYCSIYPIYFSSTCTRATGRRVSTKLATENPLAYSILQALPSILAPHMLPTAFE